MKSSYFNGFLTAVFVLMLFTGKVYAHNALVSSVPANDAAVATATELKLGFNAAVRLVRLTMTGAENKEVTLDFSPDTAAKQDYVVALPALSAGMYTVNWTLIGADGHTTGDKFSFTVDPSLAASADHANHADHAAHGAHAGDAAHADHATHAAHAAHAGDAAHGDHHAAPAATAAPAAEHQH